MPKKLLFSVTKKDFDVQTFRSGGKGGQHQNKTSSGVRIVHKDSGAVGECRETRSQYDNKEIAFNRLVGSYKFKRWLNLRISEFRERQTLEEKVDEMMGEGNLIVELKENGKWVVCVDRQSL